MLSSQHHELIIKFTVKLHYMLEYTQIKYISFNFIGYSYQ